MMAKNQSTKLEARSTQDLKTEKISDISVLQFVLRTLSFILIGTVLFFSATVHTGCGIYKFNEAVVPDSIKSIKVNIIENRAPYVNVQLSPRLSDKLRQKIISQTKLTQTNSDNADWILGGTITNYAFSTSGISNQKEVSNRLTIGLKVTVNDQKANTTTDYDISRSFEFSASQTIQQAENTLMDEILRSLTDDIFNKIFSKW
jgi:hypothetical protein